MNNIYDIRRYGKWLFLLVSALLVAMFLLVSNRLVKNLSVQERSRVEMWADATEELVNGDAVSHEDFIFGIPQLNTNIPVLLVDDNDFILEQRNFEVPEPIDSLNRTYISDVNRDFLNKKLKDLKKTSNRIEINLGGDFKQYLYYEESKLLKQLSYYPYVQLAVMLLFVCIVYFAVASTKKAEQNKVWVGLSKETAHQLGTPISSLMAWTQLLESYGVDADVVTEMNKDVKRLSVIADRFSKIGSRPEMELHYINNVITDALAYMGNRVSDKVVITTHIPDDAYGAMISLPLLEWVIENLCKNAVDAMQGRGKIDVYLTAERNKILIDVTDTGKGIARKNFKTVFNPGYTTKKRGWGLGLTLVKRIIEEYHDGRIYVKDSEIDHGTTFRIELPRVGEDA